MNAICPTPRNRLIIAESLVALSLAIIITGIALNTLNRLPNEAFHKLLCATTGVGGLSMLYVGYLVHSLRKKPSNLFRQTRVVQLEDFIEVREEDFT